MQETTHQSIVVELGPVNTFPEFTSERVYMVPVWNRVDRNRIVIDSKLRRWAPVIEQMTDGIDWTLAYLMVDQSEVQAGEAHRRPGIHIEGYWNPKAKRHQGDGGHVGAPVGGWDGGWSHQPIDRPGAVFRSHETTLLVSDHLGCVAYAGEWTGTPGKGGDCEHIDRTHTWPVFMRPNVCYAGNVTMLHESVPMNTATKRTLVRLTLPGVDTNQVSGMNFNQLRLHHLRMPHVSNEVKGSQSSL